MLSWSGSEYRMGKAVTCPQPGLLHQHVPVPCLPRGWSHPSAGHLGRQRAQRNLEEIVPTEGDVSPNQPQLQERLRGAHRAQNFIRLCSQCPGEWHRLSSVATVPQVPQVQQPKPPPSHPIPSSVRDFSIPQAQICLSQSRAEQSQPQRWCSSGAHQTSIPSGLWEQRAKLTPNPSCPHGHCSDTGSCSLSPPAPDCGAKPTTNTINIRSPSP